MLAVVPEEALRLLSELAQIPLPIRGWQLHPLRACWREAEGVIRLLPQREAPSQNWADHALPGEAEVEAWLLVAGKGVGMERALEEAGLSPGRVRFLLHSPASMASKVGGCFQEASGRLSPCSLEIVRPAADPFLRLRGLLETATLQPCTVAVIGLGSGGSLGALELAKCGVGCFHLADFDRLQAHNVSRHACGLEHVGRYKTRAVRDLILARNPQARVLCYEIDVCEDSQRLEEMVKASDLVFVATDTEVSKYIVNEACLAQEKPAVYGGAYERAFAGEVIRVVPGQTGCYACVRQEMVETMRSLASEETPDYSELDSGLKAEPGLGLDVAMIALLQAKLALLTLLRGKNCSLADIEADMILWVNNPRPDDDKLFRQPLSRHFIKVPRLPDCPVCGGLARWKS